MLTLGEVHTGLLQHSTPVSSEKAARLLDLSPGARVRRSERPIAYAVSPDRLTGVDCALPASSGAKVRAIGTVSAHASLTGGHILQGSAFTTLVRSPESHRLPWSHYLSHPGRIEFVGRAKLEDLRDGFLANHRSEDRLDVAGIAAHILDAVQGRPDLDRRSPFRSRRTKLRCVIEHAPDDKIVGAFAIESETRRTLQLRGPEEHREAMLDLCEDLALHDWLLTTLLSITETAMSTASETMQRTRRLQPAVEYLLPLWMPAARLDGAVLPVWDALERRPGFTRQWDLSVNRVRDQITLSAMLLMQEAVRSAA
ncbi:MULTISPECIES: SCO2521 family protein [Dactylosporangium]|uniref:Uncharacterized protein n=2 Tax=Dactylosporangium TaxID=35753 RepID=A0A9W6KKM2_9ACTN|nr:MULTISPECIES: SCO2521 family protein [Dactylosporangium]UAB97688.1 hypothetical protein Dvina_06070 [Dactylosporangium vinaceum]UWZ45932.1 hypothetical protein Dmats_05550 [Dactylosporangium matsuzakiense]GLL02898.1 hypothetical protein GCM10017581_046400 [Dactylosporangium matsuzakiense]